MGPFKVCTPYAVRGCIYPLALARGGPGPGCRPFRAARYPFTKNLLVSAKAAIFTRKETMLQEFDKITSTPGILNGKPCIEGTRVSVDMILEWLASGASIKDIVQAYPHLEEEGVKQALQYAARFMKNEVVIEVRSHRA